MLSTWVLSPLSWLLLALLLGCLGAASGARGRWLVRTCLVVAVVATGCMTPLVANALVGWLEKPTAAAASCGTSPPPVAVVLAGGVDAKPLDAAQLSALGITSRRRVERAVAWWQQQPGRTLIMSGGPQYAGGVPTADLMADYARRLGVPPGSVRIEGRSISSWDNAKSLARLQPSIPRRLTLITSAIHMRRARYAMGRAGFAVCAVPADSRYIPFALPGYVIPASSALAKTEAALHELVGIAYYRWVDGRSRRDVH